MSHRPHFLGRTAIVGVGTTEYSRDSGVSVLELASTSCRRAADNAGLDVSEIDGIITYSLLNDSVYAQAVAASLGGIELSIALDLSLGGQAPCYATALAAMAVESGMARHVLVFRALNGRSGLRIGSTRYESLTSDYRYPIGFGAYPQYIAMWARRFMIETGADYRDLGQVVVAQREYAASNPRAILRDRLSIDEYLSKPFVVDPFRTADCTPEVDGGCAVLVTTLDRARDLRQRPAVLEGAAWSTPRGSGLDMSDIFNWPDWSINCHAYTQNRLWSTARVTKKDIDFAEIYDCFSVVVPMTLEGLGICARGEATSWIAEGNTRPGGELPTNTHGGLLSEGYLHGMNTLAEAVLQIQGNQGQRQLQRNNVALVTSGAMMDGSALILQGDQQ